MLLLRRAPERRWTAGRAVVGHGVVEGVVEATGARASVLRDPASARGAACRSASIATGTGGAEEGSAHGHSCGLVAAGAQAGK